jgi:hypothetical protein
VSRANAVKQTEVVHSDDPPYFGGYVKENLLAFSRAVGLSVEELATLARNSFLSSFASADVTQEGVDAVDWYLNGFLNQGDHSGKPPFGTN